jgi:hypothetical protein
MRNSRPPTLRRVQGARGYGVGLANLLGIRGCKRQPAPLLLSVVSGGDVMTYATEGERKRAAQISDEKRRAERNYRPAPIDEDNRHEPSPEALADRERRLSWPRTISQRQFGDPVLPQSALWEKLQTATGDRQ